MSIDELQINRINDLLRQEFGRLASAQDVPGVYTVGVPGDNPYAVVVALPAPGLLSVFCHVSDEVDMSEPGLPEFLLREHSSMPFGRFEHHENVLMVVHNLIVEDVTGPQLAAVVLAVDCAVRTTLSTLSAAWVLPTSDD